jgi:ribonuclease P/MRP protein subunit POP5
MKKAEEEAIRRARKEIVRVRGLEEKGVLGDLISGAEDVKSQVDRAVPVTKDIMDGSEDEDMDDD